MIKEESKRRKQVLGCLARGDFFKSPPVQGRPSTGCVWELAPSSAKFPCKIKPFISSDFFLPSPHAKRFLVWHRTMNWRKKTSGNAKRKRNSRTFEKGRTCYCSVLGEKQNKAEQGNEIFQRFNTSLQLRHYTSPQALLTPQVTDQCDRENSHPGGLGSLGKPL